MNKNKSFNFKNFGSPLAANVAVIGVGYVGLPIAYNLAKSDTCCVTKKRTNHKVTAFDINKSRIKELRSALDRTQEIKSLNLKKVNNLLFTYSKKDLYKADVFIVTVPTC